MQVIDPKLLERFRQGGRCEWCGAWCPCREPHHIFSKGMGGGSQLDIRINLISLDRKCHDAVHRGDILRIDLLAVVAAREGTTQDRIVEEIYRIRRA